MDEKLKMVTILVVAMYVVVLCIGLQLGSALEEIADLKKQIEQIPQMSDEVSRGDFYQKSLPQILETPGDYIWNDGGQK